VPPIALAPASFAVALVAALVVIVISVAIADSQLGLDLGAHRTIASLAPPALLHHQYATTSTSTLSTSSLLLHQCADLLVHVLNSVQLIEKLVAGVSDPSEAHNAFCTLLVYEIDNRPATSKVIEEKMPPVLAEQWARACDEAISRVDLSKAEDDGDLLSIPNTTKRTPWWFSLRG